MRNRKVYNYNNIRFAFFSVADFSLAVPASLPSKFRSAGQIQAPGTRRLLQHRRRRSNSLSYKHMAVHLLLGCFPRSSPLAPYFHHQQRSAHLVPQKLLRQMAQQFVDSR